MTQATSIIAAGTVIRGRISTGGDLEILGHVEGSVEAEGTVTIGATGLVKSDVSAESVLVSGAVAGNLRGSARVVLEDGARVVGDLSAPSIGIRPGAKLRGRVATGEATETPARPTKAATASAKPAPAKTSESPKPRAASPATRNSIMPQPTSTARATPAAPAKTSTAAKSNTAAKRPPEPVVPVLQKRTKKAVKRRGR